MPTPNPTAPRDAMKLTALATFASGNSSRMMPNDSGNTPPPMPWTTRAAIITPMVGASAATNEPMERAASENTSMRFLPTASPRRPDDRREDRGRQQIGRQHPGDGALIGVELLSRCSTGRGPSSTASARTSRQRSRAGRTRPSSGCGGWVRTQVNLRESVGRGRARLATLRRDSTNPTKRGAASRETRFRSAGW